MKSVLKELSEIDEFFGRPARAPLSAIENYISYESNKQSEIIKSSSEVVSNEIINLSNEVVGSLEYGFNILHLNQERQTNVLKESISNIDNTINYLRGDITNLNYTLGIGFGQLNKTLSWGFKIVDEQLSLTNSFLENISELLKIPEFEKEKQFFVEKGLKFFRNAKNNKIFFNDALENLLEAEKRDKNDYFLTQKIGLIYLFSTEHLDLEKAKEYFKKSVLYSKGDFDNISSTINYKFTEVENLVNPKILASNSLKYLGLCNYLLFDYENALFNIQEALKIHPNNLEYLYDKAKYELACEETSKALVTINKLLESDYYFILKIIKDEDFILNQDVRIYLSELKKEAEKKYKILIENNDKLNLNFKSITEPFIELIKEHAIKATYIDYKEAISLLSTKKTFKNFIELYYKKKYLEIENSEVLNNFLLHKKYVFSNTEFSITEIIELENQFLNKYNIIKSKLVENKEEIKKINFETINSKLNNIINYSPNNFNSLNTLKQINDYYDYHSFEISLPRELNFSKRYLMDKNFKLTSVISLKEVSENINLFYEINSFLHLSEIIRSSKTKIDSLRKKISDLKSNIFQKLANKSTINSFDKDAKSLENKLNQLKGKEKELTNSINNKESVFFDLYYNRLGTLIRIEEFENNPGFCLIFEPNNDYKESSKFYSSEKSIIETYGIKNPDYNRILNKEYYKIGEHVKIKYNKDGYFIQTDYFKDIMQNIFSTT